MIETDSSSDGAATEGLLPPTSRHTFSKRQLREFRRYTTYALTIALVALVGIFTDWEKLGDTFFKPEIFGDQFPEVVTVAAKNTLILSLLAFCGGLIFGLILALMRLSSYRFYRTIALIYIEFFRGIPAILTLILVAFVLPISLGIRADDLLPFLGQYANASLGLTMVASAYMAETIRGGIEAVPKGQIEAARSLGMSHSRAMASIVVPQAFRVMIPPLTNEMVLLIKDTSLVFVIGVGSGSEELAFFAKRNVQDSFNGTPLMVAALMYLLITLPLTALSRYLERRGPSGRGSKSRSVRR